MKEVGKGLEGAAFEIDLEGWLGFASRGDLVGGRAIRGASLVAQTVKNLPVMQEAREMGTAFLSSILAWRIPWTEEPGGQQSMGSQRVGHD